MNYLKYCTCVYTSSTRDVFPMIVEPRNHEGVSYYLLRCTTERKKLYDLEESDGMLFPIGIIHICVHIHI